MDLKGQMGDIQPRGGVVATMATAEVAVTMVVDLASDSNHGDGGGGVGNHGDGGSDSGSGDAPRIDGTHDNHQEKSVAFAVMEMLSHPSRSPKHGRQ